MSRIKSKNFPRRDDKGRIKETCYCTVMYEDSTSYDFNINKLWIQANCDKWLFAKHDKDFDRKPHVHVTMWFKNPRLLCNLANKLNIPEASINALDTEKGEDDAMTEYDTHDTPAAIKAGKVKYDWHNFDANFDIESVIIPKDKRQSNRRAMIISFITSMDSKISYTTLVMWAQDNDCFSELLRGGWLFQGLLKEHNDKYENENKMFNSKPKAYSRRPGKYGVPYAEPGDW